MFASTMCLKPCLYPHFVNDEWLKLCKNLVHIFLLYAFLNLLVYFENKSLK
jgi:hypothetical protein